MLVLALLLSVLCVLDSRDTIGVMFVVKYIYNVAHQ